jgi:DNA-binding beta-propeller fold protein YncE
VRPPACSTSTGPASPALAAESVPVGANPFGVARSGTTTYVATSSELVVLDRSRPAAVRVPAPGGGPLLGAALAPDGRSLFIAAGVSVLVYDTATARFVGRLTDPSATGMIEVAVSPDSRYVAASDEQAGLVTVFDAANRSVAAQVRVAPLPVGLAFTPDGRSLLVTSERTAAATAGSDQPGVLQVIDTDRWTVRSTVPAGCGPVRVAVGPDGRTWVTARGSNALLMFDTRRLEDADPAALLAWIRVGPAPVGLAVADAGRRIVVANSNRFVAPDSPSTLSVVDPGRDGTPAVIASVPTEAFPRDVTASPDGSTVVASCYGGGTVEVVALAP